MLVPSDGSRTILVVEDHELSASLIMEMLRAIPAQAVHLTDTARSGLSEFHRLGFPLLVTDIGLPDGSGLDLTRKAVAADPQARVVVYSADDSAVMREGAAAAGARAFVAKSDPAELVRVIALLLAESAQVENSPHVSPERPTDSAPCAS
jgi:DNA-binding NarL/FixJ family response regulator